MCISLSLYIYIYTYYNNTLYPKLNVTREPSNSVQGLQGCGLSIIRITYIVPHMLVCVCCVQLFSDYSNRGMSLNNILYQYYWTPLSVDLDKHNFESGTGVCVCVCVCQAGVTVNDPPIQMQDTFSSQMVFAGRLLLVITPTCLHIEVLALIGVYAVLRHVYGAWLACLFES